MITATIDERNIILPGLTSNLDRHLSAPWLPACGYTLETAYGVRWNKGTASEHC
ncbi:uncharacterized protein BDW43DRAFT_266365 [Aspergillus alliaceus]|uniref:uncharacterized protein n=1 Tax=Petromyces alliaceus TaxID=209559 RepID=UPI0012A5CD74|nr:uncharacterized protein BDW43DRAFT_266365 [Aspergillus alliaceus]KAB8236878.1 hypothetical protein BDW43DRAFT_266365 [Aspergillus alliaceus]